jgi:hypothetical protein
MGMNMNKIAEVDFGKQRRDLERQLNHLLGIAERRRGELKRIPCAFTCGP